MQTDTLPLHSTLSSSALHAHLLNAQLILKANCCATALAVHLFFFGWSPQGYGAQGVQGLHGGLATGCGGETLPVPNGPREGEDGVGCSLGG